MVAQVLGFLGLILVILGVLALVGLISLSALPLFVAGAVLLLAAAFFGRAWFH